MSKRGKGGISKRGKMNRILIIFLISLATVLFVSTVFAYALEASVSVKVTVTVLPVYNLSIHLNILNSLVSQNDKLLFTVDLKKKDLVPSLSNKIYVDLNYEILKGNKVVKSGFLKTIYPTKCGREILSIKIPSDFSTGSYTLRIIATNPQSYTASDTDTFTVKRKWR